MGQFCHYWTEENDHDAIRMFVGRNAWLTVSLSPHQDTIAFYKVHLYDFSHERCKKPKLRKTKVFFRYLNICESKNLFFFALEIFLSFSIKRAYKITRIFHYINYLSFAF